MKKKLSDRPSRSNRKSYSITAGPYTLELGSKTAVMGIINMTPDSFSSDGRLKNKKKFSQTLRFANTMIKEGADILDIGGASSRPGSKTISAQEEIDRVVPIIEALVQKNIKVPISIDTYKSSVAKAALEAGASIVNTIRGHNPANGLLSQVKKHSAGLILMHMQGTPATMQKKIHYSDVIKDISVILKKSVEKCLDFEIKSDKIILDPGIGFGKTVEHNLQILNQLAYFKKLNRPLLIGTSRKSFIGHILNEKVNNRLIGSLATVSAAVLNGTHIIRTHDVKATVQTVRMIDAIMNNQS